MKKNIILKNITSEKSSFLNKKDNVFTCLVDKDADGESIKKDFERKFNVPVKSVRMLNYLIGNEDKYFAKGKRSKSKIKNMKKAYISLKKGASLDPSNFNKLID